MIKHAADESAPLLTAVERVERAFTRITANQTVTAEQQAWLDRIHAHLVENLSIQPDDFDLIPIFQREGGLAAARRAFGPQHRHPPPGDAQSALFCQCAPLFSYAQRANQRVK